MNQLLHARRMEMVGAGSFIPTFAADFMGNKAPLAYSLDADDGAGIAIAHVTIGS